MCPEGALSLASREVSDGVARQQPAPIEIQGKGENRPIGPFRRHWNDLTAAGVDLTEPADAAALQGDTRDAVIVASIDDERNLEVERRYRVSTGNGNFD